MQVYFKDALAAIDEHCQGTYDSFVCQLISRINAMWAMHSSTRLIHNRLFHSIRHSMAKNGKSSSVKKWHCLHMLGFKEKLLLLPISRTQA
ncbi:hypothetical protein SLE2022_021550 [Rubroshorea leprosula]